MRLSVEQKQIQSQTVSQQMRQALFLLPKNAWELNEYVREQALDNPVLEVIEPVWGEESGAWRLNQNAPIYEKPARRTLQDELLEGLDIKSLSEREIWAAKEIINALDTRGYFAQDIADIEQLCGVTKSQALHALYAVQQAGEAGVGARSLGECLTLQLERMGIASAAPYIIANEYLEELAQGKYAQIAEKLGIALAKCREYGRLLRSLSPGTDNDAYDAPQYIYPELEVVRDGKSLKVYIDEKKLVRPQLSGEYRINESENEVRAYIKERYAAARRLIASVDLWKSMLRRVAEKIIFAQQRFFLYDEALVPLKMTDIADGVGVNASTISRAVAGKYLVYDARTFALKDLFSRSVDEQGGCISKDAIIRSIRKLLKEKPMLSDSALAERLQNEGVKIARRTVAKYRKEMGIVSSYHRR